MSLTPRQQAIVDFIGQPRLYAPTLREIGEAVGLSSTSSVAHQIRALTAAGIIVARPKGAARAIVLTVEADTRTSLRWTPTDGAR